jgi:hypothetical protein
MQATRTMSGSRISKGVAAAATAVVAAAMLGAAGGYLAKSASGEAAPARANAAATQSWGADSYRTTRGGLQLGDQPVAVSTAKPVLKHPPLKLGSERA